MTLSDFIADAPSTHALLYRIFASEVGLLSVSSPATQFEALVTGSADLKKSALAALESGCQVWLAMPDHVLAPVDIPGRAEAHLFIELYRDLDLFTGGVAFADDYSQGVTLDQVVYPRAARAIEAQPTFAAAVQHQLQAHATKYGSAVSCRIAADLKDKFRFSPAFCAAFTQHCGLV